MLLALPQIPAIKKPKKDDSKHLRLSMYQERNQELKETVTKTKQSTA
jgi:hypothetical protein